MQTNSSDSSSARSLRGLISLHSLHRMGNKISSWMPRLVLISGVLLYLGVQITLISIGLLHRSAPYEPDDAYTYIIKAVEMKTCFFQDCPALNDLRTQLLESTDDPDIAWLRYKEYNRAFFVYHPLHSAILVVLREFGLTWESAYAVLIFSGSIFIGGSIALLLYTLWGAGPTGIALSLLALNIFSSHQLSYVSPSQLSFGIALLTISIFLRNKNKAHLAVIVGILAMITMHTGGRLYTLTTLIIYGLFGNRSQAKSYWATLGLGALFLIASFLLPLFIQRPELSLIPEPAPENWGTWLGLRNNLREALNIVNEWLNFYKGAYITGFMVGVGIISTAPIKRKESLSLLASLFMILIASLLFVLPRYPAEVFNRLWIPTAILLTGYIGQAMWAWLSTSTGWVLDIIKNEGLPDFSSSRWILTLRGWGLMLVAVFGIFIIQVFTSTIVNGSNKITQTIAKIRWIDNITLDREQPTLLISQGCETVLYMSEIPMHFYFTHGALNCGAVFYPVLADAREENKSISNQRNIRHIVAWIPVVEQDKVNEENSFELSSGEKLEFRIDSPGSLDSLYLYFDNPGGDINLRFRTQATNDSDDTDFYLSVPEKSPGWIRIQPKRDGIVEKYILIMPESTTPIFLRGVRIDPNSAYNWPWNESLTLTHISAVKKQPNKTIHFDLKALFPDFDHPLRILSDAGDTILVEVMD